MSDLKVGDVLSQFKEHPHLGEQEPPVLTLTERNGFVPQADRFNKRLATTDVSKYKLIRDGDFAFNPYLLWAGALAQNDRFDVGLISPLYPTFRAKDGFHSPYLKHLLLSEPMIQKYDSIAFGSVPRRRRSSVDNFLNLKLPPLPPLNEQRRIAAILDKASSVLQKTEYALQQLTDLGRIGFDHKYRLAHITQTVALDEVATIRSGITKGRKVPPGELYEVPYLAVANVQAGHLALGTVKTIHVSDAEREKYALRRGDLLLTEGGDPDKLGRGAVWRDEVPGAIHQNHIFKVRPNKNVVDPVFLSMALASAESKQYFLRSAKQTTGIASINMTQLRRTPVRVPSLRTQNQLAHQVTVLTKHKLRWESQLQHLQVLSQSLQSRAFRGEL